MTATEVLQYLQKEIHSTVAATVDDDGLPATCAIDVMDADENGLYFLTARGKDFYSRLKRRGYIALTGMKGKDTMSRAAVCPQACIDFSAAPAVIRQANCLHCGNCLAACPQNAVIREGF